MPLLCRFPKTISTAMPTCLLGLGSNEGDSASTLRTAVDEIAALPNIRLIRQSGWYRTRPVGGPPGQADYVNGAAVVETTIPPLTLLAELRQIEDRHGRTRAERWGTRTLDVDVLLYGNEVCETEMLTLPHPRMSFRRFVLEPAAEIAPRMLHPVIGWQIERLLLHLQQASDLLAIISPNDAMRTELFEFLIRQGNCRGFARPEFETAPHHWPPMWTDWLQVRSSTERPRPEQTSGLSYAAAAFPKLSVLLDADIARRGADKLKWSTLVRQPGRGPTLRLQTTDRDRIEAELLAAVNAVWA